MKAILLLDEMPECCYDCPLCSRSALKGVFCEATLETICEEWDNQDRDTRASWCPLKYLYDPYDMTDSRFAYDRYCEGWNDFRDEIVDMNNL